MKSTTSDMVSFRNYPTVGELLAKYPLPPPIEDWKFIEELRHPQPRKPQFQTIPTSNREIVSTKQGMIFDNQFPDPEGILLTALEYLTKLAGKGAGQTSVKPYPVTIRKLPTSCFEEFSLDISHTGCTLTANDCEGVRRGIYSLTDMLQATQSNFLQCGKWHRKPWLKTRISRCFFSPVKRWPVNTDELLDEINYYPDEYLNRLANEGINGLWLVVSLTELTETSFTPRDSLADNRIEKLHRTIRQCARFGIKIYLLSIEPYALPEDAQLVKEHPEMFGASKNGKRMFCPSSAATRQYLEELTFGVFRQAPGLGGLINITHGERPTTCLSSLQGTQNEAIPCPRCKKRKHGEVINDSLSAMASGIHKAAPEAQLFAWFYCPLTEKHAPWAHALGSYVPNSVIAQFNFESGGAKKQLGRLHRAGDYWLSYAGPSNRFIKQAHGACEAGTAVSAKLQVGCGYELGTVPFIPAPELLYRKFKTMHKLGVEHAMFCWYVGNYPGLMNYTAGQLAFENFENDARGFLDSLAKTFWGASYKSAGKAWEYFSKAYANLPFSLIFQYYGPQNTGTVWQLSAYPYLRPLSPPWKPIFPPSGDAIGESLAGFTLSEALTLMRKVNNGWQKGIEHLQKCYDASATDFECESDLCLAEALQIHFQNSVNLLLFHQLRDQLFAGQGDKNVLAEMLDLVRQEENLSLRMAALCERDSRLGFHSEALCHRYYPALLRQRAEHLRTNVTDEINELENAFHSGTPPWQQFAARPDAPKSVPPNIWQNTRQGSFSWNYHIAKGDFILRVKKTEKATKNDDLVIYFIDPTGITFPTKLRFKWQEKQIALQDDNWRLILAHRPPAAVSGKYHCKKNMATLKWALTELPISCSRLRLNLSLGTQFADGNGYEHRLYLDNFSPEQTLLLNW